jgi:hypothetical protein
MNRNDGGGASSSNEVPILGQKSYAEPPVFTPANLLREARRQKGTRLRGGPPDMRARPRRRHRRASARDGSCPS